MTRLIGIFPTNKARDESDPQLLCSIIRICVVDLCDEELNFWLQALTFHQQKEHDYEKKFLRGMKKIH